MDERAPTTVRPVETAVPASTLAARHALHTRQVERRDLVREILASADERDARADARDSLADLRDRAASLESFLHDDGYAATLEARRHAAQDRLDARADRAAAAAERVRLAEVDPTQHEPVDTT